MTNHLHKKEDVVIEKLTKEKELSNILFSLAENSYTHGSPWGLAQFQESMASPYQFYLGAFLKGECVGFLSYIEIAKEIDIHHLVVKNEAQKKGIGRKLLTFSIQDAFSRGVDAIVLEVRPSNVPAHTLYKKMNFKEIGRRKSYYHYPTEDGIIMKLENAQLEE